MTTFLIDPSSPLVAVETADEKTVWVEEVPVESLRRGNEIVDLDGRVRMVLDPEGVFRRGRVAIPIVTLGPGAATADPDATRLVECHRSSGIHSRLRPPLPTSSAASTRSA